MKRIPFTTVILLFPLFTAACNTMAGAGEDLQKGGQKLEKSADEHKNY